MALTTKAQAGGLATLGADGIVPDAQLPAGVRDFAQGAAVTDQAALTAAAPAALTSADASGGEAPTEAEYNALRADVVALHTQLTAAVADAVVARAKVNALLASLRTAALIAT